MSTKIEWTNMIPGYKGETWNPFPGCSKVSPACDNCWAEKMAVRLASNPKTAEKYKRLIQDGKWTGSVRSIPKEEVEMGTIYLDHPDIYDPIKWQKPKLVAVNLMGDPFHEKLTDWQIDIMFGLAILLPKHIFMFLTKRSERLAEYFKTPKEDLIERWGIAVWELGLSVDEDDDGSQAYCNVCNRLADEWPAKNIWLGVTVENQEYADKRIPILLEIPAAVKFVSIEPMLGAIDLISHPNNRLDFGILDKLDWVICGGESGSKARAMNPDWVRSLRNQCESEGIPFFFKQWGEWAPEYKQKEDELTCPICGCTEYNACKGGCYWVNHPVMLTDVCNKCVKKDMTLFLEGETVFKVGKKKAGRLLDGKEHNEYPQINKK